MDELAGYGMFIQNICIAARGQGLHTCPQAVWGSYHDVVEKHLGLPEIQPFTAA